MISYYCKHSESNYERYAKQYIENVLIHMNDNDAGLVDKVTASIVNILGGLPKESQFNMVPLIREIIEKVAITEIPE
jgi:hypothetical protein